MKTFEEKYTAWLDDQLTGRELSEFVASLPDKAAAEAEKAEAKKLGQLLKRELSAQSLANEGFLVTSSAKKLRRKFATWLSLAPAQPRPPTGGQFLDCCGQAQRRSLSF